MTIMKKKIKKIMIVLSIIKYLGIYFYISLIAHEGEYTIPDVNEQILMITRDENEAKNNFYESMLSMSALNICLNDNTKVISANQNYPGITPEQNKQLQFNRIEENHINYEKIFLKKLWNMINVQHLRIQLVPSFE